MIQPFKDWWTVILLFRHMCVCVCVCVCVNEKTKIGIGYYVIRAGFCLRKFDYGPENLLF